MNKTQLSKKPGSTMVLALFLLVILLIVGVGLLNLGFQSRTFAIQNISDISARSAADAGLTKAVFEMNENLEVQPWDGELLPFAENESLPNCDAIFSYTVEEDGSGNYIVKSIGSFGGAQRVIYTELNLRGPFDYAIYGKEGISLKAKATVDWYNYTDGDSPLKIGTNSTDGGSIELNNDSIINGDIVVGVDGDPDIVIRDNGATIAGETYAMLETVELPPITVPDWLEALPCGGEIEKSETIIVSGKYKKINLKNDDAVVIDGPVTLYVTDEIILGNSAEIQVDDSDPDAFLVLYLGGNYEAKNSASMNNKTKDAKKLKIYGTDDCQEMRFKNSSEFYGAIYAPNAEVTFDNFAEAYGSVVAKKFEQKNSANFNYDASLRDVDKDDEAVRFVVKQWREE